MKLQVVDNNCLNATRKETVDRIGAFLMVS